MDQNYTSEEFLTRWISGELSEVERIAFEKTAIYKQFAIINRESELLEGPEIDVEKALAIVKNKIQESKKKPKVRKLKFQYAAAASIALLIGITWVFTSKVTYTTEIGEKKLIVLADNSEVYLNANSSLSHKRFFWKSNKKVALEGEGYFTVTKGKGFVVQTSQGTVAVLGTQFNIKDRIDIFEVACYEGKVKYTNFNKKESILTKGEKVSQPKETLSKEIFDIQNPNWKDGKSVFNKQPLKVVLNELKNYYAINFKYKNVDTERIFSGSFTHKNLETALQTTLTPMGLTYTKVDSHTITISTK